MVFKIWGINENSDHAKSKWQMYLFLAIVWSIKILKEKNENNKQIPPNNINFYFVR